MSWFVPNLSEPGGREDFISRMANQMANAMEDAEEEETEGLTKRIIERRVNSALKGITPHCIRQIGYVHCLYQFNRTVMGSNSIVMGRALIEAMLVKKDWTLEFVLAASEEEELETWDRVTSALDLPTREAVLKRYHSLFANMPHASAPKGSKQDITRITPLQSAINILDRMKAFFGVGICDVCHQTALMRCSRCRKVSYCGSAHQKVAWPGHKPACKPSDDPVPVTDIEKSGLFWIGITKIPSDVTESQTAIDKLQGEQRELLKKVMGYTRARDIVIHLHLLHIGTRTQPQG